MTSSGPLDWLIDRYASRPAAIRKLIDLAIRQPVRWNADQEIRYRSGIIARLTAMMELAEDASVADKAVAFREMFTHADSLEVQRFLTYLIFLIIPDGGWPEPVVWDSAAGRPRSFHLDSQLEYAEKLVVTLLARRLRSES
ncbi:hypothetical protein HUE56_15170 [Azospirillum oryzae]|uniref:Uncharacterized protein n=1 Tax=Azospirillum oryzae TaxID=286727 RepID=A0A6N1AJV0_9PROT|nr:hypothetical protein [Azospirillum oryzae]KAA0589951.1 hypothetical protein FZ938_10170 [Azospirillum oryzae]QKS51790.1 hypothetical protein HUE56_15170 [Azospirillum oryzae]GLR81421.1 hypothetical protein GCM10007856_41070 [Azospirillum oryzae]